MNEIVNKLIETDWSVVFFLCIKVLAVIVITYIIVRMVRRWVKHTLKKAANLKESRRASTLTAIVGSISKYVLYFVAFVIILSLLDINIGPILASAGFVGLAVGFGAQNLVKDAISGFFIVFENYFAVGDYIKVGDISGYVTDMGIRTTKMRDWSGEVHVIPNGEITRVTNLSLGQLFSHFEIPVSYETDLDKVIETINQVCDTMKSDFPDEIKEGPMVLGLNKMDESRMLISVGFAALFNDKFRLEREMRKRIKEAFDAQGIGIPHYFGVYNPEFAKVKSGEENG